MSAYMVNNLPSLPLNSLKICLFNVFGHICELCVEIIHIHIIGFHQVYPHDKPLVNSLMLDIPPIVYNWERPMPIIVVVADSVFAHARCNPCFFFQRYKIGHSKCYINIISSYMLYGLGMLRLLQQGFTGAALQGQ